MKVIDVVLYSYEYDALEARFRALEGLVDHHFVVQGNRTFRGQEREITPVPYEATKTPVYQHIVQMPVTPATPWEAEFYLRYAAGAGVLANFDTSGTMILLADADEIPHPDALAAAVEYGHNARLITDLRYWYADWRAPEHPVLEHQPVLLRPQSLAILGGNDARWEAHRRFWYQPEAVGWHLSSCGSVRASVEKISTFSHSEFDTPELNNDVTQALLRSRRRDPLDRFDLVGTSDVPPNCPTRLLSNKALRDDD